MQREYKIELNITLADGGNGAGDVIEMYGSQIRDDINESAWNLCNCDDARQSAQFANLALDRWSVKHKKGSDFQVKTQFTVSAQDVGFVNQVIADYMDGFADCIAPTLNGYYSRTGNRVPFNSHPTNWEVKVK